MKKSETPIITFRFNEKKEKITGSVLLEDNPTQWEKEEVIFIDYADGQMWVRKVGDEYIAYLEDNEEQYSPALPSTSKYLNNNKKQNKQAMSTIETPATKVATPKTAAAKTVKSKAAAQPKIEETPAAPVAGNPTKIKTGKTVHDLTLRSYQELSKMYGNGFIGMSKTAIIEALNKRASKN